MHSEITSEHNLKVYSSMGNEDAIFWTSKIHYIPCFTVVQNTIF